MISAQVYSEISVAQLESIARACGFETQPNEGKDSFWMVVHGDKSLVGPSAKRTHILFLTLTGAAASLERINRFNASNALWCPVYQDLDDRNPVLMRWHIARGATRDNIAEMMFIWEHYVGIFLREFDT